MLPTSTRAIVLREHNKPLEVSTIPLPPVLEPGAALVRTTCATLCGTDVEIWSGALSFPGMLPTVLGHESVGEIVGLGGEVHDALGAPLKVGDRIGWSESTCGECHGCVILREPVACEHRGYAFRQRADVAPYAIGGLAEFSYVSRHCAKLRIPDQVKDHWASMAACAAKTVLRAVDRAGGIRTGARVVIQGSGALGIFATAVARLSGAAQVITVGAPAARLDMARRFGADEVIDIAVGSEEIVARVQDLTGRHGADYVFDFAGARSVGREAVGMAGQRGRVVIVGSTSREETPLSLGTIMGKELSMIGSLNGDIADYARAIDFFRIFADRMPWDDLFSPPVGLSAASACVDAMCRHDAIKAVIDPRLP